MTNILVPIDASACSRKAVEYAIALSPQEGPLTLLHAIPPIVSERVNHYIGRQRVQEIQREDAEAQLRDLLAYVEQTQVAHTMNYVHAPAMEAIEQFAKANHHLVVMGTHGYGRVSGFLFGSVSHPVISGLAAPVILVPETEAAPRLPKKIVIAVDGSEHAKRAAEQAIQIGRKWDAHFILLNVVTPPIVYGGIGAQNLLAVDQQELLNIGKEILAGYEHLFINYQVPYETKVILGEPASEIKKLTEAEDIDLVAMGHHGMNWVAGALMGSVTFKVMHGIKRPLLIVK